MTHLLSRESPQLVFAEGRRRARSEGTNLQEKLSVKEVVRLRMAAYQSAEEGRTLDYPPPGIEAFVPAVAKGTWRPGAGPSVTRP